MVFAVSNLRKSFGDNEVLRGVSFRSLPGQIHALLGANGAGKSTLIKCLSGAHAPDSGEIQLDGDVFHRLTPQSAHAAGIAVIYQNLSLIGSLSIADNIFLGRELRRGPLLQRRRQREQAQAVLDAMLGADYGLHVDTVVEALPMAGQQLVEIAKAISTASMRLLILDEPTAALSEREAARLKAVVRGIAARGVHVLFITHLLSDVFDICDRITVLRDGQVVLDAETPEVSRDALTQVITGKLVDPRSASAGAVDRAGPPLLELHGAGGERFSGVSLAARRGEIVGIFGLVGSGRSELLETIFGARRLAEGRIAVAGAPLASGGGPAEALRHGIALVPGERVRQAVFADLDAGANVLQPAFGQLAASPFWRNRRGERAAFAEGAAAVGLVPPDPRLPAFSFSGGNLQKIVLARWAFAFRGTRILLLDEPTQGIDVGARADIYRLLRSPELLAARTVVFTTADPDEAELLADRVLVLCRGRIAAELDAHELDRKRMIELAHASDAAALAPAQRLQ